MIHYTRFVIDTATSLGQSGDKGFFKSQAQIHITHALELLYELRRPITLVGVAKMLTEPSILKRDIENLGNLVETPRRAAVMEHFLNRFINDQPPEQIGGVREMAIIFNTS